MYPAAACTASLSSTHGADGVEGVGKPPVGAGLTDGEGVGAGLAGGVAVGSCVQNPHVSSQYPGKAHVGHTYALQAAFPSMPRSCGHVYPDAACTASLSSTHGADGVEGEAVGAGVTAVQ